MADRLEDLAAALLNAARKAGATAADAMAVDGTAISVDVRQGRLEQAERAEGIEIGLRVLIGQRQACVSASDTSARTIGDMAERAVAMAAKRPQMIPSAWPTPPIWRETGILPRWNCPTRRQTPLPPTLRPMRAAPKQRHSQSRA
jgi:predicted Zn-dependent protease